MTPGQVFFFGARRFKFAAEAVLRVSCPGSPSALDIGPIVDAIVQSRADSRWA